MGDIQNTFTYSMLCQITEKMEEQNSQKANIFKEMAIRIGYGNMDFVKSSNTFYEAFERMAQEKLIDRGAAFHLFGWSFFVEIPMDATCEFFKYVKKYLLQPGELQKEAYKRVTWKKPFNGPVSEEFCDFIGYVMQKAIEGEPRIRQSILQLYKKYYKREYNTLKKYRKLSPVDVIANIMDDEYAAAIMELLYTTRILVISDIMGIQQDKLAVFYAICEHVMENYHELLNGMFTYTPLENMETGPCDLDESVMDNLLYREDDELLRILDITNMALNYNGLADHFILQGDTLEEAKVRIETIAYPKYIAMMDTYSDNGFISDEEYMTAAVIGSLIEEFKDKLRITKESNYLINEITPEDINPSMKEIWEKQATKVSKTAESDEIRRLCKELDSIRVQLDNTRQELEKERTKSKNLEKMMKAEAWKVLNLEKMIDAAAVEPEQPTKPEQMPAAEHAKEQTKECTLSTEEKIRALRKKKVALIGGNQNWLKKIQQNDYFPEWTYISKSASSATSDSAVTDVEHAIFFTDSLSHQVYYRFIHILQAKGIPYSYLHGVNMERIVDQLYKDILGE